MKPRRRLARFNRVVTNPIQGTFAWLVPPWAVVIHRGRRSGQTYRTPVVALRRDERIYVAILYGEESDWVQNLLAAGGGEIDRLGKRQQLLEPRIEGRSLVARLGDAVPRRSA
jgi:deazaflavin-dependent oxidoreductase (nitroreductase family)